MANSEALRTMDLAQGDCRKPFLEPSLASELGCFTSEMFEFFLGQRLSEAERYGNYVALLLFQLKSGGSAKAMQVLSSCLSRNIRASDSLALLDDKTLAVVLLNATVKTTKGVLKRLEEEVTLYPACAGQQLKLALSSACYPTEAVTVEELKELAQSRLSPGLHQIRAPVPQVRLEAKS